MERFNAVADANGLPEWGRHPEVALPLSWSSPTTSCKLLLPDAITAFISGGVHWMSALYA